jgi:hypothetical protein
MLVLAIVQKLAKYNTNEIYCIRVVFGIFQVTIFRIDLKNQVK